MFNYVNNKITSIIEPRTVPHSLSIIILSGHYHDLVVLDREYNYDRLIHSIINDAFQFLKPFQFPRCQRCVQVTWMSWMIFHMPPVVSPKMRG